MSRDFHDILFEFSMISTIQDIAKLSENSRRTFFLNLYHIMVIHLTALNGPAMTLRLMQKEKDRKDKEKDRSRYYVIGKRQVRLADIRNWLRGFEGDGWEIQQDPRIHFSLCTFHQSGPPLSIFVKTFFFFGGLD
jgi:hypothetical protein